MTDQPLWREREAVTRALFRPHGGGRSLSPGERSSGPAVGVRGRSQSLGLAPGKKSKSKPWSTQDGLGR